MLTFNLVQLVVSYLDYEQPALAILARLSRQHRIKVKENGVCTGYFAKRLSQVQDCSACLTDERRFPLILEHGRAHYHVDMNILRLDMGVVLSLLQRYNMPRLVGFVMFNRSSHTLIWIDTYQMQDCYVISVLSHFQRQDRRHSKMITVKDGLIVSLVERDHQLTNKLSELTELQYESGILKSARRTHADGAVTIYNMKGRHTNQEVIPHPLNCKEYGSCKIDRRGALVREELAVGFSVIVKNHSRLGTSLKYQSLINPLIDVEVSYDYDEQGIAVIESLRLMKNRIQIVHLTRGPNGMAMHLVNRGDYKNSYKVKYALGQRINLDILDIGFTIEDILCGEKGKGRSYLRQQIEDQDSITYTIGNSSFTHNITTSQLTQELPHTARIKYDSHKNIEELYLEDVSLNTRVQLKDGVLTATLIDDSLNGCVASAAPKQENQIITWKIRQRGIIVSALNIHKMVHEVFACRQSKKRPQVPKHTTKPLLTKTKHFLQYVAAVQIN